VKARERRNSQKAQQKQEKRQEKKQEKKKEQSAAVVEAAPLPPVIAAAAAAAAAAGAGHDEKSPNHADVLVIGAGVAGMETAQVIGRSGVRAVLLEARDRFGGRILTDRTSFGCVVECGAHWIHVCFARQFCAFY
jgi:NADPH-dependent 2,4-dienoyl-CoA reductase/sulfur reductase-like enzyme